MLAHVNGTLVEESEARLSVFDRGFLFGDGIFESMRALGGRVFRLDRHLERLERAAGLVAFDLPDGFPQRIAAGIDALLRANGLLEARIRVTVTRGPGHPGDYITAEGPPSVVMSATPFTAMDETVRARGAAVAVAARRQVPPETLAPSIKSTSRLHLVLARREARALGAFEALLLDGEGHLTEGTASNIFLVERGIVLTPPAPRDGLPGVTREAVIDLAVAAGLPVREERLAAGRLRDADEAFLTNTSWEVLPVVLVDGVAVGNGRPGGVTVDLAARYRGLLRRECGLD